MIHAHSEDPDVENAAHQALEAVQQVLNVLPKAEEFDYVGHQMRLGEYDVCTRCTGPIAEAQQASRALHKAAAVCADPLVQEHLELVAQLFAQEATAAEIRAELHNGQGSEQILNQALGYLYQRGVHDTYDHSHNQGA